MNLQASATSRDAEDLLFFRMPRFVLEMFKGLDKIYRFPLCSEREIASSFHCTTCWRKVAARFFDFFLGTVAFA